MITDNPTLKTYDGLNRAYAFFNDRLFAGELPPCLVTLQRAKKAYGYFAGGRFGSKDGKTVTDEIALNPSHFRDRTTEQGVVCGRGRNPTLRLWPAIFSGEIDVFPSERRNMGQEIGR